MAKDNYIPHGKPGIASFESETWGNRDEWLFGDTPAIAERSQEVTSTAGVELPFLAVVNVDPDTGEITLATMAGGPPAVSNATHILAAPVTLGAAETMSVPLYEAGHFRQQALTFDASFNTDALKQNAFKGSDTPMILISKAKYEDADFPA